jgi:hypothetical protein
MRLTAGSLPAWQPASLPGTGSAGGGAAPLLFILTSLRHRGAHGSQRLVAARCKTRLDYCAMRLTAGSMPACQALVLQKMGR